MLGSSDQRLLVLNCGILDICQNPANAQLVPKIIFVENDLLYFLWFDIHSISADCNCLHLEISGLLLAKAGSPSSSRTMRSAQFMSTGTWRHPRIIGATKIVALLNHLADTDNVSAAKQNQALSIGLSERSLEGEKRQAGNRMLLCSRRVWLCGLGQNCGGWVQICSKIWQMQYASGLK
jgi:hypothetical protein